LTPLPAYGFNPQGWRTNMVDASGQTAYFYNAMGQLTNKVVAWTNGPVRLLVYGYDPYGTLTNLYSAYYGGVSNVYAYDLLGRLTNVLANGSVAAGYGFDLIGNLQSLAYGNGVTNLNQYDGMNRLTNQVWNVHGTPLAAYAYTLGPTGNRTALAETNNGTVRSYAWAYDSMYRLTQEMLTGGTSGTLTYGYDLVGNRTNRMSSLSVLTNQSLAFTPNDWLASDGYDSDGNTTTSSGNVYQYDALNHLTNANNGGILIAYDGDGNRARKTVGGTSTYYLLDDRNPSGYVQVLEEWTASGGTTNLSHVYNYGMDLISQTQPSVSTYYFIFDGHGSTRMLIDTGDTVHNAFAYDAYGTLIASNTTAQTAYLYCGQQFDSDLGFYYNRARYMSQNTARFWTMDTDQGKNEDPLSLHKYLYCHENPVNGVDPSGRVTVWLYVGAVVVVAGIAAYTLYEVSQAAGAHGVRPTDEQQGYIDDAKELLDAHESQYKEQIDAISVMIDHRLTRGQNIIAESPGVGQTSAGRILIGTQFLDGHQVDPLAAQIYAEFEHVGLRMGESDAEQDWQSFLQKMGWQNTPPMMYWHHGKGGM